MEALERFWSVVRVLRSVRERGQELLVGDHYYLAAADEIDRLRTALGQIKDLIDDTPISDAYADMVFATDVRAVLDTVKAG